jgi:hypothetical protein
MARDLFNGVHYAAQPVMGPIVVDDVFGGYTPIEEFFWIVAMFTSDGAVQVIKRANDHDLKTYYPIRLNHKGEYAPLWSNYLFIQWLDGVTVDLCRTTSKFLEIISIKDEDGIKRPVLVPKNAVEESMRLVTQGRFNNVTFVRKFYGRGSLVRIIDGVMHQKLVTLEIDVTPEMRGNLKIPISIGDVKAKIEIHKLAL